MSEKPHAKVEQIKHVPFLTSAVIYFNMCKYVHLIAIFVIILYKLLKEKITKP